MTKVSLIRSVFLRSYSSISRTGGTGTGLRTVKSPFQNIAFPEKHICEFLWMKSVHDHPKKIALVDGISGESLSYERCWDLLKKFGSALVKMGAQKGDVCAIIMANNLAYPIIYSGAIGIGVTVAAINNEYTPIEIARQLKTCGANVVVTEKEELSKIIEALGILGKNDIKIVLVGGDPEKTRKGFSYEKMIAEDNGEDFPKTFDDDGDVVTTILFSSGTTGLAKGVMLTHKNLVSNICQSVYKEIGFCEETTDTHQPTVLGVVPMSHALGLNITFQCMIYSGGKLIIYPKFHPRHFVKGLEDYKPTILHAPPPLVNFLANHESVKPSHFASVKNLLVGAAPVGKELMSQFYSKAPHVSCKEGWGMTEITGAGLLMPIIPKNKNPGSCGVPLPNLEFKIIDLEHSNESLGPGEVGEICVRGPTVMKGYLNDPDATGQTIDPENWLHTGDIGYYDEEEYFYIVDRLKELIKVKAFQVPPAELEDLLRGHPGVGDVAVIGIPHQLNGEAPKAFIVKKDPHLTKEILHEYVNKNVAHFKRLTGGIEFIAEIPKSPSGKILRKNLRKKKHTEDPFRIARMPC